MFPRIANPMRAQRDFLSVSVVSVLALRRRITQTSLIDVTL